MEDNKRRKVTIKDIAKEVGISPTAVSLILNNKPCRRIFFNYCKFRRTRK